ncbi:histidine phosphatase family protein [Microbacterium sp. YY-01]|uniref:histidine phosphatase family protein n=1 Tax=Microbacterium sp. YY-01 TaxID=3421634 RepID=UPI003D172A6A
MRLLLIRHGQTPSNVVGALDTAYPGAALTDLGTRQAQAVPAALTEETIAGVYASQLTRTQLTAQPLAEASGTTVTVQQGFEEILAGDAEMRSDEHSQRRYIDLLMRWARGDLSAMLPDGETGHDFFRRYANAVENVVSAHDDDDTVAVFSHGAAIRMFAGYAARSRGSGHLDNTGLVELIGDPERGWQLGRWVAEPLGGTELADTAAHDVTGE